MTNNYYKCLTDKSGQLRYYKLVNGKWKRIKTSLGIKMEQCNKPKPPTQFIPIKKRYR